MRTHTGTWRWLVYVGFLAVVGLLAAGCAAYEPFEPTPIADIPPGPGLLTGKTGAFSVVRDGELLPQLKGATSQPTDEGEADQKNLVPGEPERKRSESTVPGRKARPQ